MEHLGNPVISDNTMFIPFVKYSNQLNDKYLEKILDELKHVLGYGSAFHAAQEDFEHNAAVQSNTKPTGGKKITQENITKVKK